MECDELEDSKLHEAVRYGDIDDVRSALKQGDSPNQIGIYQWNPVHEASCNGDVDIVKVLLKYGGDPNKADLLRGSTAVHYASSNGHSEVLKLLLTADGRYNIENNDGENCLDVAKGFECQKILREQRDKELILPESPQEDIKKAILCDAKTNDSNNNNDGISDSTSLTSVISDLDTISVASSSSSRPHSRAWGTDRILGMKELQLGHVQLSFEYNVKKKTYKIRVWQVSDLLLPPPDTSMIHSVYVKSFLQPDKRKETKRKTEEVKTENIDFKEIKKKGQQHIVNFQPACFKFSRALEYENVTKDMIESRIVEVEVCIVQRYTRKSFVVATWNMPMKMTAKKLVKEKYPLKPMLSTSIPENMKVYNANEMDISFSRNYRSNPNLQRSSSKSLWAVPYPEQRAYSDSNLRNVTVDKVGEKSPSIEIKFPEEDDQELQEALQQITVMERDEKLRLGEFTSINVPNNDDFQDEDGLDIRVQDPIKIAEVQIHVPRPSSEVETLKLRTDQKKTKKSSFLSNRAKEKSALKERANRPIKAGPSFTKLEDEESSIGVPSRSESPTWDYYSNPLSFDDDIIPIDIEAPPPAGQVNLPMAIGFDLPETHSGFSRRSTKSQENEHASFSKRSSNKKYSYK